MVHELEERMKVLNIQDWQRATEQPAFDQIRQKLIELRADEAGALEEKHKRQIDQSGPSKLLAEDQRKEKLRQSDEFEHERGRYAREFFEAQRLYSEAHQQFKGHEIEKGIEGPKRSR